MKNKPTFNLFNLLGLNILGLLFVIFTTNTTRSQTVVDIIVGSENHTTLATAVTLAGLVDALSGEGPFTVFAPTDNAFAALPEGVLDALVADPEGALTDVLLYHVVNARALSTDLEDGQSITTLLGEDVRVTISDGRVFINNVEVIAANLEAGNGVVHVIDAVLVPAEDNPTSINNPITPKLRTYPNPVREILTIESNTSIEEIRMINIIGKVVHQEVVKNNFLQLPVYQFNKGTYLIQVITEKGVSVERIVINR